MLKSLFVVLIIVQVVISAVPHFRQQQIQRGKRLIEFNETTRAWMTENQIIDLMNNKVKFMDITEHQIVKKSTFVSAIPDKPTQQAIVNPLIDHLKQETLVNFVKELSAFPTRYYTSADGASAVAYLIEEYSKHSNHRTDVSIKRFQHTWLQNSVIARIEGDGSTDEIIIIGGHIDSTSSSGPAPGADDDASGSCTVLEIWRTLVTRDFKPKRAIEFHGYSAEEVGLRGSQAIVADYVDRDINVAAMMQLDMTGWVKPGSTEKFGIITDYTDADLSEFIRQLVPVYTNLPWANTRCGYGCSDHASWNRAGFRACIPFEGLFGDSDPYIHSRNDLLQYLTPSHMLEFAKLGLAYAVEMSLAD